MLSTKAAVGDSSHSWHLAPSSLSIFWREAELGHRQIFTGPQLERGRKENGASWVALGTGILTATQQVERV